MGVRSAVFINFNKGQGKSFAIEVLPPGRNLKAQERTFNGSRYLTEYKAY